MKVSYGPSISSHTLFGGFPSSISTDIGMEHKSAPSKAYCGGSDGPVHCIVSFATVHGGHLRTHLANVGPSSSKGYIPFSRD